MGLTIPALFTGVYGMDKLKTVATRKGYIAEDSIQDVNHFDDNPNTYSNYFFKLLNEEIFNKYTFCLKHVKEQDKISFLGENPSRQHCIRL